MDLRPAPAVAVRSSGMAVDYAALVKTILDGGGRSFGVEDLLAVRRAIIDDYAGPGGPTALARVDEMLRAHGWRLDD